MKHFSFTRLLILSASIGISSIPTILAHGQQLPPPFSSYDPFTVLIYVSVVFFFLVAYAVLKKKQSKHEKHILFWSMVVVLGSATLYLAAYTLTVTLLSVTNGPVHWHADFEFWACGEKLDLKDPEGFFNRVGSPVFHEHNDDRIHVEGVVNRN